MNNTIKQAIEKEQEIEKLIESAKQDLCERISKATYMDGVKPLGSNPRCVAVSFNTLCNNKHNWSPSTYIPETQASAVKEFVSSAKTAGSFQKKVEEMIETGKIKVKGEVVVLNNNTMQVLKDYIKE